MRRRIRRHLGIAPDVRGGGLTFGSDTQWSVSDSSNNPLGNAQYVALNASMPAVQPPGATQYGTFGSGWSTTSPAFRALLDLGTGITGDTPNAEPGGIRLLPEIRPRRHADLRVDLGRRRRHGPGLRERKLGRHDWEYHECFCSLCGPIGPQVIRHHAISGLGI